MDHSLKNQIIRKGPEFYNLGFVNVVAVFKEDGQVDYQFIPRFSDMVDHLLEHYNLIWSSNEKEFAFKMKDFKVINLSEDSHTNQFIGQYKKRYRRFD